MCAGPTQHRGSLFPFQCFLLAALVSLLSATSSEACGEPPTFETMQLTGQSKPLYEVGEQVHYECKPGYEQHPSFATSTTCGADGTWSSLSNYACSKKSCQVHPNPIHGKVVVPNGSVELDSKVEFVCNEGFYLVGTKVLQCQLQGSNMSWSGDPPRCEKILCKAPPQIKNGRYVPADKNEYEFSKVISYSCDNHFEGDNLTLVGASLLRCTENGNWSSDAPQCKVVKCSQPNVPNGRQISEMAEEYGYNAMVKFECIKGFSLHGSPMVVCGGDSAWEPPVPSCSLIIPVFSRIRYPTMAKPRIASGIPRQNEGSLTCKALDEWILALTFITLLELQ
ncbi:membrane cofactor protein-like [Marmota marmota marmota]|uniref:membrane cofactor protein-like n=1 Tax=Marmota marmota marmota TaxID=9994 RepID=UPI0007626A9E|nr:membrane cofactor protein-like [Marmota marmota marmota]